ncbi:hypothetical protein M3Y94_00635700 [Aphelenchoides besseyi]|nr:hypothetical protein M3Y94_00635700 [Aphelenchoides besseyi]
MTTINPLVYVLVMVFGSSSWLSTNSVWLELSLLTQKLPEGWSLPSYLALIVQIACVGPLIYSVLLKGANITISAPPVIFVLLAVCTASEFLLAFFWDRTSVVFGENRSVTLMLFLFIMALVNSTSNVLFMPYMGAFHPSYLTAYFVGMGFSSLIPSIVSLAQGTSEYECMESNGTFFPKYSPARFHVREYTMVMGVWMVIALLAFTILHFFHENLSRRSQSSNEPSSEMESSPLKGERAQEQPTTTEQTVIEEEDRSGTKRYVILIACLALICAEMNAVVPSIQSYATMSYSMLAYHMALTLSNLAHPLASFFANVGATQRCSNSCLFDRIFYHRMCYDRCFGPSKSNSVSSWKYFWQYLYGCGFHYHGVYARVSSSRFDCCSSRRCSTQRKPFVLVRCLHASWIVSRLSDHVSVGERCSFVPKCSLMCITT